MTTTLTPVTKALIEVRQGLSMNAAALRHKVCAMHISRLCKAVKDPAPIHFGHPSPYSTHGGKVITDPIPHIDYKWEYETVGDVRC